MKKKEKKKNLKALVSWQLLAACITLVERKMLGMESFKISCSDARQDVYEAVVLNEVFDFLFLWLYLERLPSQRKLLISQGVEQFVYIC